MAFTFDSTLSGTESNSYISVSQADDFFAAHLKKSYWTELKTPEKQAILVQATNRIDEEEFGGRRTITNQRLQWPRTYIVDRDRNPQMESVAEFIGGAYYRPSDVIPKEMVQAVCEVALHYISQNKGDFSVDDRDLETLSRYKVGPLDFNIKNNYKADQLPSKVKSLLRSIGPNAWMGGRALKYDR